MIYLFPTTSVAFHHVDCVRIEPIRVSFTIAMINFHFLSYYLDRVFVASKTVSVGLKICDVLKFFFSHNEVTFPLVRKDYYKAYTQIRESPSDQVQENETTYIAFPAYL